MAHHHPWDTPPVWARALEAALSILDQGPLPSVQLQLQLHAQGYGRPAIRLALARLRAMGRIEVVRYGGRTSPYTARLLEPSTPEEE